MPIHKSSDSWLGAEKQNADLIKHRTDFSYTGRISNIINFFFRN